MTFSQFVRNSDVARRDALLRFEQQQLEAAATCVETGIVPPGAFLIEQDYSEQTWAAMYDGWCWFMALIEREEGA